MNTTSRLTLIAISMSAVFLSACDADVEEPGRLPEVEIEVTEGKLPEVDIETAEITVGEKEVDVTVPDVDVEMEEKTITVPDVDVKMPNDE